MSTNAPFMIGEDPIVIDSSVLGKYSQELDEVFRMYIEDINPFIVRFETAKSEFPVEVQNEIRAIYGHLIRATMPKDPDADPDEDVVARNISRIKSHSKRALLDCFKYTSIVFSDNYEDFMTRYEGIDLTYIEEGRFLPRIVKACNDARKKLQDAKIAETSNISEDKLFDMYQEAYRDFEKMNEELEKAEEKAAFLQHKATKKEKDAEKSFKIGKISLWVGIGSLFVGIASLVVAFII